VALGTVVVFALTSAAVAAALSEWLLGALALLTGMTCGLVLLVWGVTRTMATQVAAMAAAVSTVSGQVKKLQRQSESEAARRKRLGELQERSGREVHELVARLEQLATQVSFPLLSRQAPGDPVSTRFADYLDQPALRQSDRLEALLEVLARDATERQAFEQFVRHQLTGKAGRAGDPEEQTT
jgi:hypothetical protein